MLQPSQLSAGATTCGSPLHPCAYVCLLHPQDLVAEVPAAKELFDKAADILGYDLLKVANK